MEQTKPKNVGITHRRLFSLKENARQYQIFRNTNGLDTDRKTKDSCIIYIRSNNSSKRQQLIWEVN